MNSPGTLIISINGDPGSGKSSVAKELAKTLHFKHYSGGDMRGLLAKERGITIDELNKLGENDPSTDKDVDAKVVELGKKQDDCIIDSRTAWHFIPHSIKVFLKTDAKVAAERIFKDRQQKKTTRTDEPQYRSPADVEKHLATRVASDKKRYKKYYGFDHTDPKHYDLVLDTTHMTIEQAVERVLAFVKTK